MQFCACCQIFASHPGVRKTFNIFDTAGTGHLLSSLTAIPFVTSQEGDFYMMQKAINVWLTDQFIKFNLT